MQGPPMGYPQQPQGQYPQQQYPGQPGPQGAPQGAPPPGGKSGFVTMMLAIGPAIFGIFGIHRFYTGHIGIGVAQLLTFGGCGIWQLVDIISIITRKYTDSEGRQLLRDHPIRKMM